MPREGDGAWPLVSSQTMRELDRYTIEELGVPGEVLMESAGRAVLERVLLRLQQGSARQVVLVCGRGNNGGDAFVVARHLQQLGVPLRCLLVGERARVAGDALANLVRAEAVGVEVEAFDADGWQRSVHDGAETTVFVDALFGTGLTREVSGDACEAIDGLRRAREAGGYVIAVDLPSGLDGDRGAVLGTSVEADETVTIGLPKLGLVQSPGRELAGRVCVARIGIADRTPQARPDAWLHSLQSAAAALPARPATGHKGRFGHVLVAAGSLGKSGAAALCADGVLRGGAGLATIACPVGINAVLEVKCSEAMTVPLAETPAGGFSAAAEAELLELVAERDVCVLGPGLGRDPETVTLVRALVKRLAAQPPRATVLDADALFALGTEASVLQGLPSLVLTPHPGEAARLLATDNAAINADRVGAARQLSQMSGAVVVLKGAATVIAGPDGALAINPTGGPLLSSGGTGDVLAGLLAALLAQGCDAFPAASLAAYLHGAAGDRLAQQRGGRGILASEVAAALPETIEDVRRVGHESAKDAAGRWNEPGQRDRGALLAPLLFPLGGA